jgi:hypothetical protein
LLESEDSLTYLLKDMSELPSSLYDLGYLR